MGHTLTASGQRRGQGHPSLLAERTETALRLVIGRGHGEGDSLPGAPRTPPVRRRERLGRRRQLCQDPQEGEAPAMWLGSCHTPLVRPDTGELPGHCHSQDLTALGSRAGCRTRTPRTLAGPRRGRLVAARVRERVPIQTRKHTPSAQARLSRLSLAG